MYNLKEVPYNLVICRYSEIALKGKNRWVFEQLLMGRISKLLKTLKDIRVTKIRGRILIHYGDWRVLNPGDIDIINKALQYIFGLDSYSFVIRATPKLNDISNLIMDSIETIIHKITCNRLEESPVSFRIRVRRLDKSIEPKRNIEVFLADNVLRQYGNLKVDLINADLSIYCEIYKDYAFVFYDKNPGQKGLPSGSNPPVLSLLSGGFDSPVASYMMMRRGVFVDFLSFHSYPFTPKETEEKIKNIVKQLNKFQGERKLFLCNFLEVQKEICVKTYEAFRTIHYRRIMFKLAERIAEKNKNKALITGESIGQVASQTVINLANIDSAVDMLVLRPLIAMDKSDTMAIAKKIGTFDLSALQVPDSCTVFSPSNPSTGAPRGRILRGEQLMNIEDLINTAWKNTVSINVETNEEIPLSELF